MHRNLFEKERITAILLALCLLPFAPMYTDVFAEETVTPFLSYHFADMQNVPTSFECNAINGHSVNPRLEITNDAGVNVLKWVQSERNANNISNSYINIPFDNNINARYPITVEYSAKFDENQKIDHTFSLVGKTADGEDVKIKYGVSKWAVHYSVKFQVANVLKDDGNTIDCYNAESRIKYNGELISGEKYYVHKYVINADGTYDYYIKEDTPYARWEKPYGDNTLIISYEGAREMPAVVTGLYSRAGYFNGNTNNFTDAEKADMAKDASMYCRYINVKPYAPSGLLHEDFRKSFSLPEGITHGALSGHSVNSSVSIAEDNGEKVLKWSKTERAENKLSESCLNIPFACSKKAEYPLTVEYSAKFDDKETLGHIFSLVGKTSNGDDVTIQYGIFKWAVHYSVKYQVSGLKKADGGELDYFDPQTQLKYNGELISADKYYVHKYIINADGTYEYYLKEDVQNAEWEKPYGDDILTVTYNGNMKAMPTIISGLYSQTGFFNGNANNFTESEQEIMAQPAVDYIKYIHVYNPTVLYASPDGDDFANGTLTSPLSLTGALNRVNEQQIETAIPATIFLRGGNYCIEETLLINSGMNGLKIAAYADEKVNILGQYPISADKISIADAEDLNGRLPQNLLGKILKIDLSDVPTGYIDFEADYENSKKGSVGDAFKVGDEFKKENVFHSELVDGGNVQTLARWPDEEWAYMGKVLSETETEAVFVTDNQLNWDTNAKDIKIVNFRNMEYNCLPGSISEINSENNTVKITQISSGLFNENSRYYFYNVPEEISMRGEYYIDYADKTAYYYPQNSSNVNIAFTILPKGIIRIAANTKDITIDGINFSGTRGTAIYAENSKNINVKGCKITNTGDCGILMNNCTDCDVTSCIFDEIGNTSVFVGGGNRAALISGNNTITDCRFTNGARISHTSEPFVYVAGAGANVAHNYFYNHMASALMFNGNNHVIENNIFDNVVNNTQDLGAIYAGQNVTYWGNVIRNNIFKNIRTYFRDERFGAAHAVYIDDTMPGTTIENNLFYNCTQPISIGGGIGNTVKGNLIYDCYDGGGYGYRSTIEDWQNKDGVSWYRVQSLQKSDGYDEEKWYNSYPEFKELVEDMENGNSETLSEFVSGTSSIKGITIPESHKVKHAVIKDNLIICGKTKNGGNGNLSMRTAFTLGDKVRYMVYGLWELVENGTYAVYKVTPSGEYCNNYVSSNLSAVTITDGKKITIDDSLYSGSFQDDGHKNGYLNNEGIGGTFTEEKFTPPDVSKAGTLTVDVSDIDGNACGTYVPQKNRRSYAASSKIFADDFENELSGVFDISGNATLQNGNLKISFGSAVLTPPETLIGDTAVGITLDGIAKIQLSDGTNTMEFTEKADGETLEYLIKDGTITKYTASKTKREQNEVKSCALTGIKNITISGIGTNVDYVAVCEYESTGLEDAEFISGFSDAFTGAAVQSYSDNLFTYNMYSGSGEYFVNDNGNKAIKMEQKEDSHSGGVFEIFVNPTMLKGNVLTIDFSIKSDGGMDSVKGYGFNSDKDEDILAAFTVSCDTSGNILHNGTIIADFAELANDYVRLRILLSGENVYVYRKNSNGEYELKSTAAEVVLPEYFDRLEFKCKSSAGSSFLIDDTAIYKQSAILPKTSNGELLYSLSDAVGAVKFTPWYIPGHNGTSSAAVYGKDGKLLSTVLSDYLPQTDVTVNLPEDYSGYTIKHFTWENQKPINECIILK